MIKHCATLRFFQPLLNKLLILILCVIFSGCASYKINTAQFSEYEITDQDPEYIKNKNDALNNRLYCVVPRHRCQLNWYDVGHWTSWTLFGNDDDGIFGEDINAKYRIHSPNTFGKALRWWCRNPLHNFCFYVIGSAHRQNSAFIILQINDHQIHCFQYYKNASYNFPGTGSGFYMALHGGKPFASLRLCYSSKHRSEFYVGWRYRGNFGIKCTPLKTTKSDT